MLTIFSRTAPTQANLWSFVLVTILLAVLGGCDGSENQEYQKQLDALSNRLSSLETNAKGQAMVLQQILDRVSPPQLPANWENRLGQLEVRAGDVNQWPKGARETGEFFEQTAELAADLPAWAEADHLPRLNLVRWSSMAFERLHDLQGNHHSVDQLEEIVFDLRNLADAAPEGVSEALVERLRKSASETASRITNRRVTEAILEAQSYIKGDLDVAPGIVEIYEFLELFEEDHDLVDDNVNIAALRKSLYRVMVQRQAAEQAAVLTAQWKNVKKLPNHQPLYEVSARMVLQRIMSAHTTFVLEGIATTAYDELESELNHAIETIEFNAAKRRENRQAQAMRSYQRWALSRIKDFEAAFQSTSHKAAQAASILPLGDGGWSDPYYQEVRQAMIIDLLPINPALLDLPVRERYQQVFQTGWNKLDGREDQTAVAEASALIVKKSLPEFMERKGS